MVQSVKILVQISHSIFCITLLLIQLPTDVPGNQQVMVQVRGELNGVWGIGFSLAQHWLLCISGGMNQLTEDLSLHSSPPTPVKVYFSNKLIDFKNVCSFYQ